MWSLLKGTEEKLAAGNLAPLVALLLFRLFPSTENFHWMSIILALISLSCLGILWIYFLIRSKPRVFWFFYAFNIVLILAICLKILHLEGGDFFWVIAQSFITTFSVIYFFGGILKETGKLKWLFTAISITLFAEISYFFSSNHSHKYLFPFLLFILLVLLLKQKDWKETHYYFLFSVALIQINEILLYSWNALG
jgi:hypothetical protein